MSAAKRIAATIHDAINEGTTAAEDVHRSIAELPLSLIEAVTPLAEPLRDVRDVQARSIGAIYGLVRSVNDRVGRLAADVLPD